MKMILDVNEPLKEKFFEKYRESAKMLIPKIRDDRKLSDFDTFNKRFKISWGMEIAYTDDLKITQEDTRYCYILMLKISDLWFAFENLVGLARDVIPKDKNLNSNIDFYEESILKELQFDSITSNFNQLLYSRVLHRESWRKEVYTLLSYLKNNTKGGTQKTLDDVIFCIKKKSQLEAKHIFSLMYGLRNIYVHKGVAAALGGKDYKVKRVLYSVMYDSLILYSLALGDNYCRKKLCSYLEDSVQ